jgi:hypothetical protein
MLNFYQYNVFITFFLFSSLEIPKICNINDNNNHSPADGTIMSIEDDNIKD